MNRIADFISDCGDCLSEWIEEHPGISTAVAVFVVLAVMGFAGYAGWRSAPTPTKPDVPSALDKVLDEKQSTRPDPYLMTNEFYALKLKVAVLEGRVDALASLLKDRAQVTPEKPAQFWDGVSPRGAEAETAKPLDVPTPEAYYDEKVHGRGLFTHAPVYSVVPPSMVPVLPLTTFPAPESSAAQTVIRTVPDDSTKPRTVIHTRVGGLH